MSLFSFKHSFLSLLEPQPLPPDPPPSARRCVAGKSHLRCRLWESRRRTDSICRSPDSFFLATLICSAQPPRRYPRSSRSTLSSIAGRENSYFISYQNEIQWLLYFNARSVPTHTQFSPYLKFICFVVPREREALCARKRTTVAVMAEVVVEIRLRSSEFAGSLGYPNLMLEESEAASKR